MKFRSGNREERENVISETADEKEEKEAQREPAAEQGEPDLLPLRQRGGIIAGNRCWRNTTSSADLIGICQRNMV